MPCTHRTDSIPGLPAPCMHPRRSRPAMHAMMTAPHCSSAQGQSPSRVPGGVSHPTNTHCHTETHMDNLILS